MERSSTLADVSVCLCFPLFFTSRTGGATADVEATGVAPSPEASAVEASAGRLGLERATERGMNIVGGPETRRRSAGRE